MKTTLQPCRLTASNQNFNNTTFQITHPFHPYRNIEFEVDSVRRLAYESRGLFIKPKRRINTVPHHRTDIGVEDYIVALTAGRTILMVV
jgi:hypothetical protein